jgi:serine phosphatase RsbU (regulator of sigma subunit)
VGSSRPIKPRSTRSGEGLPERQEGHDLKGQGARAQDVKGHGRTARKRRTISLLRIPISLKFAGFIAVLVVAFMSWQTYTATQAAKRSLDEEINRGGVQLVTALATTIEPAWLVDPGSLPLLVRTLSDFSSSPGADRILNVVVEDSRAPIATARGESRFSRSAGRRLEDPAAAAAGVEIHEFTYEGAPVRSFARPLSTRASETRSGAPQPAAPATTGYLGRVEVYISARSIADSRRRLSNAMLGVALTASGVAALGSYLLARYLTIPIRALEKDMKQVTLGNLEHQSNVSSSDELGMLAHAFNVMTESLQAAQEAKVAQRALEYELSLASKIQARLLPPQVPRVSGFDIAVHYAAAKEVSGDYYDFLRVDDERLGFVVADVSGKGVPAALVMTMTRSLLRIAARAEPSPARPLELVNRFLTPDLDRGLFVTVAYSILSPSTSEVLTARAGHNPPLYFQASERKILRVQPRGVAIGLHRQGSIFDAELKVQRISLGAGDILLAYTDGIVEAKDREGKDYTEARLAEIVMASAERSASDLVATIVADVERHQRGCERSDDITVVALKKL